MPSWLSFILGGGFLGFLQFMITRYDKKHDRIAQLEKINDDKFKDLEKKLNEGLDEREAKGKERFDINTKKIEENTQQISKLEEAIIKMAESNEKTNEALQKSIERTNETIESVAELSKGLGQDKLVFLADKYRIRGGITIREKACLKSIYLPYSKKLNGNGLGEQAYKFCMEELPTLSDEEAMERDRKNMTYLM